MTSTEDSMVAQPQEAARRQVTPGLQDTMPVTDALGMADTAEAATQTVSGHAPTDEVPAGEAEDAPGERADAIPEPRPNDADSAMVETAPSRMAERERTGEMSTLHPGTKTGGELASTEPALSRSSRGRHRGYQRGATIGRYIVLDQLGAGTMGAVYSAYDPELDRRIAVKLLATAQARSVKARQRLLREARALARLSHPNVIQVYDVGIQGDDVFVAMELVEGESLDQLIHRSPRPDWRKVLKLYLQAARGLAAAHGVGLIHRDFKPSNVLIGKDGRVRVADFGLAAAAQRELTDVTEVGKVSDDESEYAVEAHDDIGAPMQEAGTGPVDFGPENDERPTASPMRPSLDEHITDPGTIMGTPAFMAPEQHSGDEVGPQADQYAFCVALYVGLYGELPFQPPETPRPMVALLGRKVREEIEPAPVGSPVPEWLRKVVIRGLAARPEGRWPSMRALMDALADDPDARRRRRMSQVAVGLAVIGLSGVAAFGWLRTPALQPEHTCDQATRELAEIWSPEIGLRIQGAFLATGVADAHDTYRRVADALDDYASQWTEMRVEACEATWVRKQQSEQTLDLRIYCLDQRKSRLRALTELLRQSATPEVVNNSLAAALTLPSIGYCADIEALVAAVPPPEQPELRERVEALQKQLDDAEELRRTAGRYDDALAISLDMLDESRSLAYPAIRARALLKVAELRRNTGAEKAAEDLLEEAILTAARAGDDEYLARAWLELLWNVGYVQARHDDAVDLVLPAEAAVERTDDDLIRAEFWLTRGALASSAGDHTTAAEYEARALNAQKKRTPVNQVELAQTLNNLAVSKMEMGKHDEAHALLRQALDIRTKVLSPWHPQVAQSLANLARATAHTGALSEARELNERALAIYERSLGPQHWLVGFALDELADVLTEMGAYDEALPAFTRAINIFESQQGADHPRVAEALLGLGRLHERRGRPEEALPHYERALTIARKAKRLHLLAQSQFALAQAMWTVGRDRAAARALAKEAEVTFGDLGQADKRDQVSRWLLALPAAR
ncbi:protein kinase domain-containing protein [Haliangium sp.]|uniref:protein kinase domain-containing protein n=1 Tax=Haliangium sp. TaxID=2663208 RepID=UPI003D0A3E27